MSRKKTPLLTDEWHKLKRQVEVGKPQPLALPVVLPLRSIRMWPAVFQHRGPKGVDGDRHVRNLAASIRKSKSRTLDPVKVRWDGKGWACIDGHHRIDAYKAASVGRTHTVPVEAFEGSQDEAMSEAASGNTKDKLSMSGAEKSNAAWRMVVVTAMSKANVAMASGVSESTSPICAGSMPN